MSAMQEVLSKHREFNVPLKEMECYELSLLDTPDLMGTQYSVRQAYAQWSEIDREVIWGQEEVEYFWTPEEADRCYEGRIEALAKKGFDCSGICEKMKHVCSKKFVSRYVWT